MTNSKHGSCQDPRLPYYRACSRLKRVSSYLVARNRREGSPPTPAKEGEVSAVHEPFSLLVSVYGGDRAAHVRRAFRSAVDDQSVRPDQLVILRDGPVNDDLTSFLDDLRANSLLPATFVPLPRNLGLGPALDQGLVACWFDGVARMDADDIAMPHRYEVGLPLVEHADVAGSGLLEFMEDTDHIVDRRVPPIGPSQIRRYA